MAVSTRTRFEVLKRDGYVCRYCGRGAPSVVLHVDHVKPRSRGGRDTWANLVTACQDCNLGKAHIPLPVTVERLVAENERCLTPCTTCGERIVLTFSEMSSVDPSSTWRHSGCVEKEPAKTPTCAECGVLLAEDELYMCDPCFDKEGIEYAREQRRELVELAELDIQIEGITGIEDEIEAWDRLALAAGL